MAAEDKSKEVNEDEVVDAIKQEDEQIEEEQIFADPENDEYLKFGPMSIKKLKTE